MKNFDEWNILKKKIEKRSYIPPEVIESGQVYWFSFGLNIGKEIGGKNESFTRPAMIYKVITRTTFLVIPITTSENYNDEWHMSLFNHQNIKVFLCFNQVRVMDFRRMKNYMYSLNQIDLSRAIDQFENLFYIRTATDVAGDRDRRSDASAVALTNSISDKDILSNKNI